MNSEDIIFHSFKINEGYKSEEWGVGENELLFSILGRINGHVCLPEPVVTWILILFRLLQMKKKKTWYQLTLNTILLSDF